mmetsp:Transcript_854/g.1148  ORF Transcript_854/g.1148 Transcript_854/m.1148 type:complete len:541 (-) Transcript_854:163-1785(-)|eukprot:CAMPEP_0185728342 /NCGR_PEP_ID=MMETSP1171-20130828/3718_1 /TAXON_ID=374046 /ORGANISM="Helicotheca tamensis, Strain CCMP826" /LENGTH=540 /DNA_ID=CAMNT_0028397041 /DNA_START=207 /DNA_END=1829 /DNA_ORIENTATION=+
MMNHQVAIPLIISFILVAAVTGNTGGSNNNNGGSNFKNNDFSSQNQQQQSYSLTQHASFNPLDESLSVSAETEAMAFYSEDDDVASTTASDMEDGASKTSSSTTTSSFVSASISSEALYVSGGELQNFQVNECSFYNRLEEEDDEDSDDEDDDDDDGHSSMLSNASLRRSTLVSAGGAESDERFVSRRSSHGSSDEGNEPTWTAMARSNKRPAAFFSKSSTTSSSHLASTLSIRGGSTAVAQDAGTEFARRLLVAAIVTLLYEGALGHLLEFVKIVMQTSPPGTTYAHVLRTITAEKGIAGVWDGFVPWGVIQAVGKGGVFGLAHAVAKKYLQPFIDDGTLPEVIGLTLAGGIAGGFQGYVLSPTLLLKTRVMTNDVFREKMSLLRTTLLSLTIGFDVVKHEGVLTLMKGSNVFALKRVFDWSTRYFFSDIFESLLLSRSAADKLTATEKIVASLLGGTASTISTLPLDVLVAKTQDAKKAGEKVSAWNMFVEELEEKGWAGLYDSYMKGFEARLAHVCFTTVAMKVGTAFLYDAMYGQK